MTILRDSEQERIDRAIKRYGRRRYPHDSRVGRSWRCGSCYGPHPAPIPHQAEQIVEKYAGKEPEVLRMIS